MSPYARSWRIWTTGLPYFYDPVRRVITEANLRVLSVLTVLNTMIGYLLANFVEIIGEDWSRKDLEVYLKVDEIKRIIQYYFIDHRKRSILWLQDIATDAIDIPRTVSYGVLCEFLRDRSKLPTSHHLFQQLYSWPISIGCTSNGSGLTWRSQEAYTKRLVRSWSSNSLVSKSFVWIAVRFD